MAISEDGTLIFGSSRDGVRSALAAAAGTEPSFDDRADVAPLLRAAPPDLVSALLVDGELLRAVADPAGAFLGDESPQDFATRVAGGADRGTALATGSGGTAGSDGRSPP